MSERVHAEIPLGAGAASSAPCVSLMPTTIKRRPPVLASAAAGGAFCGAAQAMARPSKRATRRMAQLLRDPGTAYKQFARHVGKSATKDAATGASANPPAARPDDTAVTSAA